MNPQPAPAPAPRPAPAAARPSKPGRFGTPWAVAAVFIVGILVAGVPFGILVVTWGNTVAGAPGRVGTALTQMAADAMRPKFFLREIVVSNIEDLKRQQKLVVLEPVVSADVTREEGDSSWGMYWGTNVARVAVKDAHTQYVIDLSGMQTSDYLYDDSAKTLRVIVPKPRLDMDMISIDPAKIQTLDLSGGWARWDKRDTRDRAIAELKPTIIVQASKPFIKEQANEAGIAAMQSILSPLAQALKPQGVKVEVHYQGE
ncbi:MAG TPA: DUF4230 domain-containing protein [Phycisphaerae bacterium]|nr:DUF4230 domain-containing protein [Phycisphaerae bacterium]